MTAGDPRLRRARRTRRALRLALLDWYDTAGRDLPWRRTRDPYHVWVSEIMAQQTQIVRVVPYFERFVARFPDVASLAEAEPDEVLALWSGLGYYRRARALHDGAKTVVRDHGGRVPLDPDARLALPGVGRYTAGAIGSVAFDLPEPILDGNVRRLLARLFAIDAAAIGTAAEQRLLWALAEVLVDGPRPGDLNQALMELGALVCTPRAPSCEACPLARRCAARREGEPARYPAAAARAARTRLRVAVGWLTRGERVLLARRRERAPLRGSWDLPAAELPGAADPCAALAAATTLTLSLDDRPRQQLTHGIMNRTLELEVYSGSVRGGRVAARDDLEWVDVRALGERAVSGATLKVARSVAGERPSSRRRATAETSTPAT